MSRLDLISEKVTLIVEREVDRLLETEHLDNYAIKNLETVNKILSILMDRQDGKHDDEYKETSTADLLKEFE